MVNFGFVSTGSRRAAALKLIVFCAIMFGAADAYALFLTRISSAFVDARSCPGSSCSEVSGHNLHSGKQVVIHEVKNGWARVSNQAGASAVWVPLSSFPDNVAQSFGADAVEENEPKKKPANLAPTKIPTPTRKPSSIAQAEGEPATEPQTPATTQDSSEEQSTTEIAGDVEIAQSKSSAEGDVNPELSTGEEPAVASAPDGEVTEIANTEPETEPVSEQGNETENQAEVTSEPATAEVPTVQTSETTPEAPEVLEGGSAQESEPAVETASLESKMPEKLTPELKDDRLKRLPLKPDGEYSLKSIIAMRFNALKLIEEGQCGGIKEGGNSISSPGWVYLVCEGEYFYRQFQVE